MMTSMLLTMLMRMLMRIRMTMMTMRMTMRRTKRMMMLRTARVIMTMRKWSYLVSPVAVVVRATRRRASPTSPRTPLR